MEKKANLINWIAAKNWGLNYKNCGLLYKAAFEPAILYTASVWSEAIKNIHMRNKLASLQRKYTIQIVKAYNTAPSNALLVLANILPLHIQAKILSWHWQLTTSNYNSNENANETTTNIIKDIKRTIFANKTQQQNKIDRKLNKQETLKHPAEEPNYYILWDPEESLNLHTNYTIYTDGSKNQNGTGSGFNIRNSKNRTIYQSYQHLAPYCTNSEAEMWAIYSALQYIINNTDKYKKTIKILTDSKKILHLMNNQKKLTCLGHHMITTAGNLGNKRKLFIGWLPSHTGIEGNEVADKLAKLNTRKSNYYSFSNIPLSIVKNQLTSFANNIWQEEWQSSNTGRSCYIIIPSIKDRQKTKHFTPDKNSTQILTGHRNFPAYLHRIGKRSSDKCNCGEVGDANHYLFHCIIYDQLRLKVIKNCLSKGIIWPPDPPQILKDKDLWKEMMSFINKTGILEPSHV
ncbi:uncharacterized protein [Centruroides vittatus]|uniref:uncharacterized protein n=1 Tax=Centruroides vittatus TaxID=120091 RepID=UPI00350FCD20